MTSTDEEVSILIDSNGLPNKCSLPITRVSNHQGDGNIVDIATTLQIIGIAKESYFIHQE